MSDLLQAMADDAAQRVVRMPTNDELQSVGELANEQLRLEQLLDEQEAATKETKEKLARVREFDLPNALDAFGISAVTLLDKSVVTIKEDVYAGITEANRDAAFQWLEDTENDGIIKNEVKCPFGKGQNEEVRGLVELLESKGYSFTNNRTVHPQTLKAFVRKQLEDGLHIPMEVFSVHIKKVASIKLPRKR